MPVPTFFLFDMGFVYLSHIMILEDGVAVDIQGNQNWNEVLML